MGQMKPRIFDEWVLVAMERDTGDLIGYWTGDEWIPEMDLKRIVIFRTRKGAIAVSGMLEEPDIMVGEKMISGGLRLF